uniref:Uncharacterized protein n=1 Tax=Glossina palpalis gambiensis TaxID=67801 RepID=A0A1B0C245_9MUSC
MLPVENRRYSWAITISINAQNYRHTQWIVEGEDPEEMEYLSKKIKYELKGQRKERRKCSESKKSSKLMEYERFEVISAEKFQSGQKKSKSKLNEKSPSKVKKLKRYDKSFQLCSSTNDNKTTSVKVKSSK